MIFMGTGPFGIPSFDALLACGHHCVGVVTRPQRSGPGGKAAPPSPVRVWGESAGLPLVAPESVNAPEMIDLLRSWQPDLLVVCDYGEILKPAVLEVARLGGVNLHGSLLPAYRGAAPVQRAVLSGDHETGVSVIHMTSRLDAGPVLAWRSTPIGPKETAGMLESRLAQLGVDAMLEGVATLAAQFPTGIAAPTGRRQDSQGATRAPRLAKSEGAICWGQTARAIDAHVRGMQPWPMASTDLVGENQGSLERRRLMIVDLDLEDEDVGSDVQPGTLRLGERTLWVATADRWVRLNVIRPAGRRDMTVQQWLLGRPFAGLQNPRLE